MSEVTGPCGCRLVMDRGIMHLFPCRDDCPSIPAICEAFRRKFPGVPAVDGRPMESALGRHLATEEIDAIMETIAKKP